MWQDKLKEVIYILENSNMNEIDVTFWGRRYRVVKSAGVNINSQSQSDAKLTTVKKDEPLENKAENIKKTNGEEFLILDPNNLASPSPDAAPFLKEGDKFNRVIHYLLLKP